MVCLESCIMIMNPQIGNDTYLATLVVITQLLFWADMVYSLGDYTSTSTAMLKEIREIHTDIREIKDLIKQL